MFAELFIKRFSLCGLPLHEDGRKMRKMGGGCKKVGAKGGRFINYAYLCPAFGAQMAESVDALVSNTSGATRAGSTPALGTRLPNTEEAVSS